MRRMSHAASLPVLVDADHGYGNALNVRRTVQELEAAGAAGLPSRIRCCRKPTGSEPAVDLARGGIGKMKAALDGRGDPSLVTMGRTGAARAAARADRGLHCARRPERPPASMRCSSPAIKTPRRTGKRFRQRPRCRSCLDGAPEDMSALDYLAGQRVRIALQGHAPFAAATQAVYETLKALREGTSPED